MIKVKIKVGARGQIVIPKIIRESLGIAENNVVILELQDKKLFLVANERNKDIVKRWEEIAKKEGTDVTKNIKYGDELYEEIF